MKPELEKQLVEKFPKIFGEVGKTPQQSCMAFGICVGDGWYWLIEQLCRELQNGVDNTYPARPQIVAAQVKEKFGGLRFYVNSGSDEQYGAIHFAETLSYSICEECGSMKDVSQDKNGWIKTRCSSCRKSLNEEAKKKLAEIDSEKNPKK